MSKDEEVEIDHLINGHLHKPLNYNKVTEYYQKYIIDSKSLNLINGVIDKFSNRISILSDASSRKTERISTCSNEVIEELKHICGEILMVEDNKTLLKK